MTPSAGSRVFSLRARVVLWYLGLLALALVVSVIALRQFLMVGLEESVTASLTQEVDELRLFATGTDPSTGQPYGADVRAMFSDFIAGDIPEATEASFFLVDGEPFDSNRGAPIDLLQDPSLVAQWAALEEPQFGRADTPSGQVRFLAVPLVVDGQVRGTFIATHFLGPELGEINQAVRLMALISGSMLVIVSIVGWLTVGRVVAPIRRLTDTAQNITDSQLGERLPVTGNDEVAELTRTFNTMLDRLQDAFADQRRFLDDIGHELRTPLTIVRGNLELLPEDPAEREQTLALCLDELDRMNRYVTELILLAKAEKPDFLHIGPVELAELTEGMSSRLASIAPDRICHIDNVERSVIEADHERLTQAWLNLVTNAVQHTGPGGLVALGSAIVDDEARMWVRDDGPGVPLEDQEHIFERFGRGRDTGTRRRDGTGLGLAIVGAIARAHGGRVQVESRPGQGARFTVIVPVRPQGLEDEPPTDITYDVTRQITEKVGAP